jgi:putative cell wall-binding protein
MKTQYVLMAILLFGIGTVSGQAANVVILVSDNPADLAVANTLAEKLNIEVVVTPWGTLSDEAVAKIKATGATEVYVVGGNVAVPDVETKVDISVKRFAGEDRYQTSALVAGEWKECPEVYIAVGVDEHGIQEARAKAKAKGCPIVYVKPDSVPGSVEVTLEKLQVNVAVVVPTPNMKTDVIKERIKGRGIGEVSEVEIDFRARAQDAIAAAENAITLAEENTSEVADGRSLAAARLVINAKTLLDRAREAFDAGDYGKAFGLATAAKAEAESSVKISNGVVVGLFKNSVLAAETDIAKQGLAKIKGQIEVEAGKFGVKIGITKKVVTEKAGEAPIPKTPAGKGGGE